MVLETTDRTTTITSALYILENPLIMSAIVYFSSAPARLVCRHLNPDPRQPAPLLYDSCALAPAYTQ